MKSILENIYINFLILIIKLVRFIDAEAYKQALEEESQEDQKELKRILGDK